MASICQEPQLKSLDSFFSAFSDRDKLEHITEILNQYSLHGIPEISMTPSIKRASSMQEQQSSPSGDSESGILPRSIDTLDTDPTVTLREKKSRTPSMLSSSSTKLANQSSLSAGSSSGFNTLTANQSTLSADGGGRRSSSSSLRRKSYQPPASSQQAMQEVFQSNRPGSYQESSTTVVQSSISLNVTPSASVSIEENVITIDPDDSDLYIETNWRDLVTDWESVLNKRSLGQMDAFWELLYTEVFYIKHLRVIHNLFHVCLSNLQKEGLLLDVSIIPILITYSDQARFYGDSIHYGAHINKKYSD